MKLTRFTKEQVTARINIEGRFQLALSGARFECDPDRDTSTVQPAIRLYKRVVSSVGIDPSGMLLVLFDGGDSIVVPPDPEYESWSVDISTSHKIIGGIKGEIFIFDPTE